MNTNNAHTIVGRFILFSACIVFLCSGCEKQSESEKQPKVISKKIVMAQKDEDKAGTDQGIKSSPKIVKDKKANAEPQNKQVPESEIEDLSKTLSSEEKPEEKKADKVENKAALEPEIVPKTEIKPSDGKPAPRTAAPSVEISRKDAQKSIGYEYNAAGKVDPFATIFKEQPKEVQPEVKETEENKRIPLTPLEKISLSQLKLAAVMLAPSGDKALVEEASGKGYVITQGTYIGKNSGQVVDILMDRIIIEEKVQDLLGKTVVKKTEMMLQKTPGE